MADGGYSVPVILHSSVQVNPNSDAVVPATDLLNPLGLPLELLEIRFRGIAFSADGVTDPAAFGTTFGVKLDIGRVPIIDSYVPAAALGTYRDSHDTSAEQAVLLYTASDPNQVNPVVYQSQPTTYQWRLKYPLFLPVDAVPTLVVHSMGGNRFTLQVDVAFICRTWDARRPVPRTIKVPWATSYVSKGYDYVVSAPLSGDQSSNLNIVNPFATPLELTRLVGRVAYTTAGSQPRTSEDPSTMRYSLGSMTIRSSRGFDIVKNPTAIGGVFPYSWRAWEMTDWFMAPREFYSVRLNMIANPDTTIATAAVYQTVVGAVGYRSVPTNALLES